MADDFVDARLRKILSDCKLQWVEDCSQLQAQLGLKGQFGGSMGLDLAIRQFGVRLREATMQALREFANAIEVRGKRWRNAHQLLADLVKSEFADVPEMARNMMLRGAMDDGEITHRFKRDISDAVAEIYAHEQWTAPRPSRWHERHPIWLAAVTAIIGIALGLAAKPIGEFIETQLGQNEADSRPPKTRVISE